MRQYIDVLYDIMTQLSISSGKQLCKCGYKDPPCGDDVSNLSVDSNVSYDASDIRIGSSGLSYDINS